MLRHLLRQCLRTTTRTVGDLALHVAVYRYVRRMMHEHPKLADHIRHSYEVMTTTNAYDDKAVAGFVQASVATPPETH